jgi:hypothetical protein
MTVRLRLRAVKTAVARRDEIASGKICPPTHPLAQFESGSTSSSPSPLDLAILTRPVIL